MCVSQARSHLSQRQIEAAQGLGAGAVSRFRWVIWPQIRWAFGSACTQVFSYCSMSFALVLILGGGPPVQTLETEIFQRVHYGSVDFSGAAVSAVWQLLINVLPWALLLFFRAGRKERGKFPRICSIFWLVHSIDSNHYPWDSFHLCRALF